MNGDPPPEAEAAAPPETKPDGKPSALDVTKVVAGVAVLSYLVGVLTVSIYLHRLDLAAPDLTTFKARYVYTGLIVLLWLAVAAAAVWLAGRALFLENPSGSASDHSRWWAALLLVFPVLTGFCFARALRTPLGFTNEHVVKTALVVVLVCYLAALLGVVAWEVNRRTQSAHRVSPAVAVCAVLGLAAGFWYVSLFSRDLYPILPEQYGGGEPKQAYFLFSKDGAKEAAQLGVPLEPQAPQLSRPVTLLLENGDFYAVKLPTGPVVQLAQSSVLGLKVDSQRPHGLDVQAANHNGPAGVPNVGDKLVFTYSEAMNPARIAQSWSGAPRIVWVSVAPRGSTAELRVWSDHSRTKELPLGTVDMGSRRYSYLFGDRAYPGTMTENGPRVIIDVINAPPLKDLRGPRGQMSWSPSDSATDLAGNQCQTVKVNESSGKTQDREF